MQLTRPIITKCERDVCSNVISVVDSFCGL
jgi:hypothetical protein